MKKNLNVQPKTLEDIIKKAENNHSLSKNEILRLLYSDNNNLFIAADKIRSKFKGNNIHLRALLEFTNICKNNCLYCGLQCKNKNIERYRLTESEIIENVENAIKLGYKTIVLQGGEDNFYDTDKICSIIKQIKKYDVALTLSIGEKTFDEYKEMKKAGADRYLLRIETTDKKLYKKMHPNMSFDNRMQCLYNIKELGFETGTGCLVGLPNQTKESLANDILFFKKLDADMVGIGPFIPHPDTPLRNEPKDHFYSALKVMAITRLILPDINIPATTAMETIKENGRIIALQSGANVIMPNITDIKYSSKYEIYPNKSNINSYNENFINNISERFKTIGRTVSNSKGFRK